MANTISYGDTVIKTITEAGTFTLSTAGKVMTDDIILHLDADHKFSVKMSWGGRVRLYTRSMTRILRCFGLYMADDITVEVADVANSTDGNVIMYTGEDDIPHIYHITDQGTVPLVYDSIPGKYFSHWECNGSTFTYYELPIDYTFGSQIYPRIDDYVVQAVFSESEVLRRGTSVILTSRYRPTEHDAIFGVTNSIGSNDTMIRCGLLASPAGSYDPDISDLTEANAAYVKSASTNFKISNYTWRKTNVMPGDVWYLRGYLVWSEDGVEQPEIYSPLVKFVAGS